MPYVLVHANHGDSPNGVRALLPLRSMRERLGHPETGHAVAARAIPGAFPEPLSAAASSHSPATRSR